MLWSWKSPRRVLWWLGTVSLLSLHHPEALDRGKITERQLAGTFLLRLSGKLPAPSWRLLPRLILTAPAPRALSCLCPLTRRDSWKWLASSIRGLEGGFMLRQVIPCRHTHEVFFLWNSLCLRILVCILNACSTLFVLLCLLWTLTCVWSDFGVLFMLVAVILPLIIFRCWLFHLERTPLQSMCLNSKVRWEWPTQPSTVRDSEKAVFPGRKGSRVGSSLECSCWNRNLQLDS